MHVHYIDRLDYVRLSVRRSFVRKRCKFDHSSQHPRQRPPGHLQSANTGFPGLLLATSTPSCLKRFYVNADRQPPEDQNVITSWFEALHKAMAEYGIVPRGYLEYRRDCVWYRCWKEPVISDHSPPKGSIFRASNKSRISNGDRGNKCWRCLNFIRKGPQKQLVSRQGFVRRYYDCPFGFWLLQYNA